MISPLPRDFDLFLLRVLRASVVSLLSSRVPRCSSLGSSLTISPRIGTSRRSSRRLNALKYEGVELRTAHAHGVEVSLTPHRGAEVKARFDDSPIELAGLGSAFEYQAADPAVVRANIDGTKEYVRLAHDVGAPGVKVRPNGIPKGADPEATFRRIGEALREVGRDAADFGIEIRVEVHGEVTSWCPNVAEILDSRRPPQRLRLLELQPDRRRGRRDDRGELQAGRAEGPRGPPPRPDRRGVSLARAVRPPDRAGLHGATRSPRSPPAPTPSASWPTSGRSGWPTSPTRTESRHRKAQDER